MNEVRSRTVVRAPSGRIQEISQPNPDPAKFADALRRHINGEVRFSSGDRALYSTDASNYRQVPMGLVIPKSLDDVRRAIEVCRKNGVSIVSRGGGTSLAGQTIDTGVVIDFSKYLNRIVELNPAARTARVEPGCVLDVLRHSAEEYNLTFGPDPATHNHNTLGGMIGNNSCGVHSVYAGRTADNVLGLRVLTYRGVEMDVGPTSEEQLRAIVEAGGPKGEIYRNLDALRSRYADLIRERFPKIPRRVSGYADLDKLLPENGFDVAKALVGTEGTCVTILDASLQLVQSPPERSMVIIGFQAIAAAGDAIPAILEHSPLAIEAVDDFLVDAMKRKKLNIDRLSILPDGRAWLLVEFGGYSMEEAEGKARKLESSLGDRRDVCTRIVLDSGDQKDAWLIREAGLPASAYVPGRPEAWEGWEDSAVPRERLGEYIRALQTLLDKYDYQSPLYGHFGDGLVHSRISFDLKTEEGITKWRSFMDETADLVVSFGGTLSGEHGDGQARAELLEKMYGRELVEAFAEFKRIWDPDGLMNPGKVVDPYPITSNLRLGPSYNPPPLETFFSFADEGGFRGAAERCVGVGKCRRTEREDQVMCPSFMATREEKHSTRGRSRLLFEMLHGGPLKDGWRSDEVEDALSLCLACKGCKSDCPVNVDMATYKAEFRAHHYAGRLRPRAAYSMGLIYWWSRMASLSPRLANTALRAPVISSVLKRAGGISEHREMPRYANQPFTSWFKQRQEANQRGRKVILWPDTFNNYFRPETAIAAVRCLEAAGMQVTIPPRPLCCGRPLYDWGFLKQAKRLWSQTFDALRQEIEAGTTIVGLEPACVAAFKDELPNLFPKHDLASKLSAQTHYFSDFMIQNWPEAKNAALENAAPEISAMVHVHCHHHAVIGKAGEEELLRRLGVEHRVLPSGCCGMAGSFGFDAETYGLSMSLAEAVLLPEARKHPDQAIVASGYSCREQIEQGSTRQTMHAAELMASRLKATASG